MANKELWTEYNGKGFGAEYADYAVRATKDEDGNVIAETYATKALMTGATAQTDGDAGLVPAPLIADKDKYLKGDGTWSTINIAEQKVDILTKTSGLTTDDFDTAWNAIANGHIIGVWYTIDRVPYLFLMDKYYTHYTAGNRIVFTHVRNPVMLENQYEGIVRDALTWNRSGTSMVLSTIPIMPSPTNQFNKFLFTSGQGGAPSWRSVNEVPSSTSSDSGKVLKVNQSGNAEWAEAGSGLPDPTESNSLLLGQSDGSKAWNALSRDVMGTPLLDESNRPILDENSNPVYDANSTTDLWTSFAGHEFGAKRAYADQEGNNIKATYARKEVLDDLASVLDTINDTLESVSHSGMYDLGDKTEDDLINGKLAIGCGNSTTALTLTTVNAVTILANSGVPNFALLIDNSGNSNAVTVTVKDSTDTTTFMQSVSAGNEVTAGKIYQLTCVGKCWTLAEFGIANA